MKAMTRTPTFSITAVVAALALIPLLSAVMPSGLAAQLMEGGEASRVKVVLGLGYEVGGPGDAIADAMRELGLDQTKPEECVINICEPARDHPWQQRGGLDITFMLGAEYDLDGPLYIEGIFSNGVKGNVHGWNGAVEAVDVAYVPFVLAGSVGYDFDRFRIAAGPIGVLTMWDVTDRSEGVIEESTTISPGAVIEGAFKTTYRGSLVTFRARYRLGTDADIVAPDVNQNMSAAYRGLIIGATITVAP